jgi:hypothetical protein
VYITECKKFKILPKSGTLVRTEIDSTLDLPGWKSKIYLDSRRTGFGVFLDFVAGSSGDWWWIEHTDKSIGIYNVSEVYDR